MFSTDNGHFKLCKLLFGILKRCDPNGNPKCWISVYKSLISLNAIGNTGLKLMSLKTSDLNYFLS